MVKHLSEEQITKLCRESPDTTIKDYIELLQELSDIAATQLPLAVVEQQRFRRKWNRIRSNQKEKV